MQPTSIGDLAQSFINRRANARMTSELSTLGTELTTGLKSDTGSAVSGDTGPLTAIERSLARLTAWGTATSEAKVLTDGVQSVLKRVHTEVSDLTPTLLQVSTGGDPTGFDAAVGEASESFRAAVAALNTTVAGQSLFSGEASTGAALRDGAAILADITAAVAGATDAATVETIIDGYFDAGGGFETNDYLGAATARSEIRISDGMSIDVPAKADDAEIRTALKALVKVAVMGEGALDGDQDQRHLLLAAATDEIIAADGVLVGLRADVGTAQERVDQTITQNASERHALRQSRLDLLAADPYETAARMEQVQAQIEALYTVTARLSRLNLTNFLR